VLCSAYALLSPPTTIPQCPTSTQTSTAVNTLLTLYPPTYHSSLDLYGNDEPEFGEQTEDGTTAEATSQPDPKPAAKPAPAPAPATSTPAAAETSQQQSHPPAQAQAPIPSFAPVTQQIPTYEQPQPSEYRNAGASSAEAYQNMSAAERSVRPSEMKDEG
jgi:hypothetical protein